MPWRLAGKGSCHTLRYHDFSLSSCRWAAQDKGSSDFDALRRAVGDRSPVRIAATMSGARKPNRMALRTTFIVHAMRESQFLYGFIGTIRELTDPRVGSADCLHQAGIGTGARFGGALIDLDKWSSRVR